MYDEGNNLNIWFDVKNVGEIKLDKTEIITSWKLNWTSIVDDFKMSLKARWWFRIILEIHVKEKQIYCSGKYGRDKTTIFG